MSKIISPKIFYFFALYLLLLFFFFLNLNETYAQICLPLEGYLVWPGTWERGWVPMASSSQYYLTRSPIFVDTANNVGIGVTTPVFKLQVQGDISGTRLCIGSDCRSVWPGGGIAGTGSAGQVAFWTGSTQIAGDNNLFWDNTNKRLGIGITTPASSLHVVGAITANNFIGTINAANVSSGQFGANTGGGNYSFPGNVGIGTTNPGYKLDVAGTIRTTESIIACTNNTTNCFIQISDDGKFVDPNTGWVEFQGTYSGGGLRITGTGNNLTVGGNVGIGTTNPGYKLHVEGHTAINGHLSILGTNRDALNFERQGTFHRQAFYELRFWDWDTGGDMVTFNNGNVGIGTTAPKAKLDVYDGDIVVGRPQEIHGTTHRQYIIHGAWNNLYITPRNDANTDWWWGRDLVIAAPAGYVHARSLSLYVDGNVGIGTTAPGYRLDVNGYIRGQGICIGNDCRTSWPLSQNMELHIPLSGFVHYDAPGSPDYTRFYVPSIPWTYYSSRFPSGSQFFWNVSWYVDWVETAFEGVWVVLYDQTNGTEVAVVHEPGLIQGWRKWRSDSVAFTPIEGHTYSVRTFPRKTNAKWGVVMSEIKVIK